MAKGSKLAVKSTELVGLLEKLGSEKTDGFFEKETWVFENSWAEPIWCRLRLKQLANLMLNANGTVKFLKTFKSCVFCKKRWVFRKKPWNFQKSLMVTNLLYNAKELVRFLKNVQILGVGSIKEYFGFSRKTEEF